MKDNILKFGIMSFDDYKRRTTAIAKGEYRQREDEPKVWFESVQSAARVLSNENQELLRTIIRQRPDSLKELEEGTGREQESLSRSLEDMARYGIVELVRQNSVTKPIVRATDFRIEFGINPSF
ncbi:MAG: transcriptional regulator [Desulfobacteraceae bacterium 4572_88]|nr:MAG: transcriptional regulator [Desulfobacteraceae bacterium 4572_88]